MLRRIQSLQRVPAGGVKMRAPDEVTPEGTIALKFSSRTCPAVPADQTRFVLEELAPAGVQTLRDLIRQEEAQGRTSVVDVATPPRAAAKDSAVMLEVPDAVHTKRKVCFSIGVVLSRGGREALRGRPLSA
jgi:hypothetical protein